MGKGKSKAAPGSRAGSVAREILKRRDKPFRSDIKKGKSLDQAYAKQAPSGYTFLPVGTPDLAELCKDLSKQRQKSIYVVNNNRKSSILADPTKVSHHLNRLGYYFHAEVVSDACRQLSYVLHEGQFLKETDLQAQLAQSRIAKTMAKHGLKPNKPTNPETPDKVGAAIRELFPKIPQEDLDKIVDHAWAEGTSRIGTIQGVSLARRVQLAVIARIRHTYTDYDSLLHAFGHWAEARQTVEPECLRKLIEWRGENALGDDEELHEIVRETIVIPDEDEDDDVDLAHSSEADDEDSAEHGDTSDASAEVTHRLAADEDLRAETVDEASRRWHGRSRLRDARQMEDWNSIARQKVGDMRRMIREAPPSTYRFHDPEETSDLMLDRIAQAVSVRPDANGEAPESIVIDGQVFRRVSYKCLGTARGPPLSDTHIVQGPSNLAPIHESRYGQPAAIEQHRHLLPEYVAAQRNHISAPLPASRLQYIASQDSPIASIEPHDDFRRAPQTPPVAYSRYPLHFESSGQLTPDFERAEKRRRLDPIDPGQAHTYYNDQQPSSGRSTIAARRTPPQHHQAVGFTYPQRVHYGSDRNLIDHHIPIDAQRARTYDSGPSTLRTGPAYSRPFDEQVSHPIAVQERRILDTEDEEYDPTKPQIQMSQRAHLRPMHRSETRSETYLSQPDVYPPRSDAYLPHPDVHLRQSGVARYALERPPTSTHGPSPGHYLGREHAGSQRPIYLLPSDHRPPLPAQPIHGAPAAVQPAPWPPAVLTGQRHGHVVNGLAPAPPPPPQPVHGGINPVQMYRSPR